MRATQASRHRSSALFTSQTGRQAALTEWNFSGNVGRSGPIGLVTKRKQSVVALFDQRKRRTGPHFGNKENSTSDFVQ